MAKREEGCKKSREEETKQTNPRPKCEGKNFKWEKPTLEDVSGKVMAQPYIRFT